MVADIDADGLMIAVEAKAIQQPFGDRSAVVIEPMLTDQWYVDAATLAKPAIEAARKGAANGGFDIVPKSWEKTYFNWMENIQPWCVSRQLWWGHRIPAWFDADGNIFVAEDEAGAQALAGEGVAITQDEDVLDTWFSSALWPFGTLGWPEEAQGTVPSGEAAPWTVPEAGGSGATSQGQSPSGDSPRGSASLLNRHYPNDVLVSGFDILFFWDARMAMQGIHFMKEVPWKTLYLHGLVRAADGSKMSKSKGNTVDPLGLIDQYGADALRFFMAAMESQGRDIKMDESRVAGYRNFATKLWNAARFAQSNGIGGSHSISAPKAELAVNRWIIGEIVETVEKLNKAFAEFRFDGMADAIYHFVWDQFCDWYLELIKPLLNPPPLGEVADAPASDGGGPGQTPSASLRSAPPPKGEDWGAAETRKVAGWVLDQILVMLHPFMPFITEELWHALSDPAHPRKYDLIHAKWPEPTAEVDAGAKADVDWLIRLISQIRTARTELNVPPSARLPFAALDPDPAHRERLERHRDILARLARVDVSVAIGGEVQIIVDGVTYVLALGTTIDLDAERTRISKAIEAVTKERDSLQGRLSNAAFVEKAKPEAVDKARFDHAEKAAEAERLTAALARLG